ncbi:tRNA pseudouridine(38-40) synthase TruA [Tautonia sociabilis]|uniref:tRNA pseudouridine synthase A n=1 Tax=Tautonia sociabilis TaxID=2080755 RepID=A0A432MKU1_9BACT|nr:tRNA pseudouridine(38-40) synthase TruA [Tautonia sociabilis]RUL88044.1 tRNA pseudouridine(38-40) synthase TruA [Tautonia sociabilis]
MRNIRLTICYDGSDFHGWQRQPDFPSVQEALEMAVEQITGHRPDITASGRTDAGVHALGQVVHFFCPSRLAPEVLVRAINAKLPRSIRVLDAEDVPQAFHATLDARSKRYRYVIDNAPIPDPFRRRYSWHVGSRLDEAAMHRAAQALRGRHDFRSFETEWPNRTSSVRTILDIAVSRDGPVVTIEVEADGFLYNMVRSITGTLVLIGAGRRPESFAAEALAAQSRAAAGPTAPPQGLFLLLVRYGRTPATPLDEEGPPRPHLP